MLFFFSFFLFLSFLYFFPQTSGEVKVSHKGAVFDCITLHRAGSIPANKRSVFIFIFIFVFIFVFVIVFVLLSFWGRNEGGRRREKGRKEMKKLPLSVGRVKVMGSSTSDNFFLASVVLSFLFLTPKKKYSIKLKKEKRIAIGRKKKGKEKGKKGETFSYERKFSHHIHLFQQGLKKKNE